MTALEQNVVCRGCAAAALIINQLKPVLDSLNILYDSQDGAKKTIDETSLDAIPSFSDLTKQQLDDGMYALTVTLKTAIDGAFTQLAQLAARS